MTDPRPRDLARLVRARYPECSALFYPSPLVPNRDGFRSYHGVVVFPGHKVGTALAVDWPATIDALSVRVFGADSYPDCFFALRVDPDTPGRERRARLKHARRALAHLRRRDGGRHYQY